ncbi:MAG: ATP-binding protein [Flavobacteriaceae bacterium]
MKKFFINYYIVALIFVNATFVFSQETNNIDSIIQIANNKIRLEKFNDAEKLLDSLKSLKEYQIDSVQLKVDLQVAIIYQLQNQDGKALELLLKGLTKIEKNQNSKYIADYAFQIGRKFAKINNFPKANEYYRKVLINSKYRNDSLGISKGFLSLGSIHLLYVKQKFTVNLGMDDTTYKMHRDSALYYHNKAIDYSINSKEGQLYLATVYNNLIGYYYFIDEYKMAEEYGDKSIKILEVLGDSIKMVGALINLGAISSVRKDFIKANKYYFQGLNLVKNKKDYRSVNNKQLFLRNIADLYKRQEKYKEAYTYRIKFEELRDSLNLVNANEKYAEYEAKYNVSEEEKHTEIEKNKRKSAEMWLYIVGASTTVLLLFVWLFYRGQKVKREKKLLVLQKEALVKEREIEQLNNEAQIKILNATIDGKEAERQQIAEILHNSVSALLSSAGLHLQAAKIELKENAPEEISKSQAIVEEAGDKIRDLSHQLISSVLMNFGLGFAMDDLCEKYSNSKLSFKCESENIQRYSSDFEIKIHSIIDELVNNVIKHSDATEAQILLKENEKYFEIKIIDNGKGFDVNKIRSKFDVGLGLPQIEARIKMMDGVFEINSSEETGTHIYMKLPIPK